MRVALKRLDLLGLVRSVPRVGYIVTSVGWTTSTRSSRCASGWSRSPHVSPPRAPPTASSPRLERLAHEPLGLSRSRSRRAQAALARSNTAFHQSVARLSGSRRLERAIRGLVDELERMVHMLGSMRCSSRCGQHSELLRVLQ